MNLFACFQAAIPPSLFTYIFCFRCISDELTEKLIIPASEVKSRAGKHPGFYRANRRDAL